MSAEIPIGYPHTHRMLTVSGLYWRLNLAMAIPVLFGVSRSGAAALLMLFVAVGTALFVDFALSMLTGLPISGVANGRAISIGLFTAGMTGVEAGAIYITVAVVCAVLIGVWMVGGPGRYWLHPAMLGLAVANTIMPERVIGGGNVDVVNGSGRIVGVFAELVGRRIFEPLAIRVPVEIWERLTSLEAIPGAPIVAGAIPLIFLASLIVYGEDLVPISIPIAVFLAFVLLEWAIGGTAGRPFQGEPLSALLNGGVLFAVVFGLAEPGVRPRSSAGIIVFGLSLGALLAFFSHNEAVTSPSIAAFLIAGSCAPLFDATVSRLR